MRFISWNVNGLRACLTKGFPEFFQQIDADIFCLQETKLQQGQVEMVLPGYRQYWNSAVKKGYSGTAVFSKKEPLSVSYGLGIEEHDQEGRVITLEFPAFYLTTVYTPNSQEGLKRLSYRMEWEDAFRINLKELESRKPLPDGTPVPVILSGDLNVAATEMDIKNAKTNVKNAGFTPEERAKFQEPLASGFTDTFRFLHPDTIKYSWWSYRFKAREKNAGWRLDFFLISQFASDRVQEAEILTDILGSDHCPVMLVL